MDRVLNTSTTEYRIFSQGSGKSLQSKGGKRELVIPCHYVVTWLQRVGCRCPWDSISYGAPNQNDSNTSGMYCQTPIGVDGKQSRNWSREIANLYQTWSRHSVTRICESRILHTFVPVLAVRCTRHSGTRLCESVILDTRVVVLAVWLRFHRNTTVRQNEVK